MKGRLLISAPVLIFALCLVSIWVCAEPFIINDDGGDLGKGLEIGYLAGDFTCSINIKNNDDEVTVKIYEHRGIASSNWEWDEEDILVALGPGESYSYWINMTHAQTLYHRIDMQIVWVDGYVATDVENIAMDVDIKVWDPDGKEFPLEDLKDKDKVWERYLETHGEYEDDPLPIIPIVASSCGVLLFAIIAIIVIMIIILKKRSK
jgi:hypothetical protein